MAPSSGLQEGVVSPFSNKFCSFVVFFFFLNNLKKRRNNKFSIKGRMGWFPSNIINLKIEQRETVETETSIFLTICEYFWFYVRNTFIEAETNTGKYMKGSNQTHDGRLAVSWVKWHQVVSCVHGLLCKKHIYKSHDYTMCLEKRRYDTSHGSCFFFFLHFY